DYKVYQRLKRSIGRICDRNEVNLRTVRKANKPTHNDITHPLVKAFTQQVTNHIGVIPKPFSAHGATDARFYADKGVPCILMSPPGGGAHSNDEWLDKEGYEQFRAILRAYLDDVARLETPQKIKQQGLYLAE
ncbi:MAG TPA: M20/M25/M40 family metallo-hydrolase, partial [Candidatus Saccharimonadales bacterium]|nr:M20/M25/M40 family metallo-hydrolase [Candidatus Saccharimonadales bacterium]